MSALRILPDSILRLGGGAGLRAFGAGQTYAEKILSIETASLIGYWRLEEASGAVLDSSAQANNGAVVGAPTRGATGKVGKCYTLDGSSTCIDVYSAGFAADFSPTEITLAAWIKLATADTTTRGIIRLRADASNLVNINKGNTNQTLTFSYAAGGTAKVINDTATVLTNWVHVAVTVSKTADEVKGFVNGAQVGATQTGLGVWAGALASSSCVIGALTNTPTSVWTGEIDEACVWSKALTPAQILQLATI